MHSTPFSVSDHITAEEFKEDPNELARLWVSSVGQNLNTYKKITIPAYSLEFKSWIQGLNPSKFSKAKDFTLNVYLDLESQETLLKEITQISYLRIKEKFKKMGLELVEWSEVKNKSEEARRFETDYLNTQSVAKFSDTISITTDGAGRLRSQLWNPGAAATSRESEITLVLMSFTVGFGYFNGTPTNFTFKSCLEESGLHFTPQVQIQAGSGFQYWALYEGGQVYLDRTAVLDGPFSKNFTKLNQSTDNTVFNYSLQIEPQKYKEMVLRQLDIVEDLLIQKYYLAKQEAAK